MNTKLFDKYMSFLDHTHSHIDEQTIVNLRSFINNKVKDTEHYQAIMCKAGSYTKLLSAEQNEKGIAWLRKTQFKKNGQLSESKACFIAQFEAAVINNFSHFEFVGLKDYGRGHIRNVLPIYKVVANDRSWFNYCGNEVLDIGRPV